MVQEGYDGLPWSEVSAFNQPSAAATVSGWMSSAPHRAILLDSKVNEIGMGYAFNDAGTYRETWVADTGKSQ
jgi:uncharacterized protein YkwD